MSKMVQIRSVPDALHRKLKVRVADAGQSLSEYLLAELERVAPRAVVWFNTYLFSGGHEAGLRKADHRQLGVTDSNRAQNHSYYS